MRALSRLDCAAAVAIVLAAFPTLAAAVVTEPSEKKSTIPSTSTMWANAQNDDDEEDKTFVRCSESACGLDGPGDSEISCSDTVGCGDEVCCGIDGTAKQKPNPAATSHKGVFYANDFSYLNDPNYTGHALGDSFKLMPVAGGDFGTLDLGGQLRGRYHHEQGMGQAATPPGLVRFEPNYQDFYLTRLRLYANWKASDSVRVFCEGILADVTDDHHTYVPRPIDRNFGDFLNLFADLTLVEGATARVGRQELLYGAERLISPLDWANTRRTFDGARLLLREGDWSGDVFYTYVVPVIPNRLDESDYKQAFYGWYNTVVVSENLSVDAYYIGYDNRHTGAGNDFSIHTTGIRLFGSLTDDWLFEMEGGPQFGRQSGLGLNQEAMFCTGGIGRKLGDMLPWTPTLWCYYDYASGNAGGGDYNQFNPLFPLGHKYFGFIDAVQRSNIESPNMLLTMAPTDKVSLLVWYWHFMANQAGAIVPSIGGTPPQSLASKDLGDELDLIAKYAFGPRANALIGYSHFWRGNKILAPVDADFTYVQWELNF